MWLVAFIFTIFGLIVVGWGGLHLTLIGEFAGKELTGTATGFAATIALSGNLVGPPVFGHIVDISGGSYQSAWVFLAICALASMVLFLFIREEERKA
jgi:sugar phosphate permease